MGETVSIIIPCYRQGRYLAAAIDSALGQSHAPLEVIVVDDGSDDDTGAVGQSFAARVRYVRKANGGPASARNLGIAQAAGNYLMFLDADDLLHKEALAWLVKAMGGREDVVSVMGIRWFENEADLETGRVDRPPGDLGMLERKLLVYNVNPPIAFLCARSMAQRVGGFDAGKGVDSCEDWDFWTKLYFAGAELRPIERVEERVGAYYRQHANSHSRNMARTCASRAEVLWRSVENVRAVPGRVEKNGLKAAGLIWDMRRELAKEHRDAAYALRGQGRYAAAWRHYRWSLTRGHFNTTALAGMVKLPVHGLIKGGIFRSGGEKAGGGSGVPVDGKAVARGR